MKILYRKSDNRVVMIGENKENKELLSAVVDNDEKFKEGYIMYYKNSKIEYQKSDKIINEEIVKKNSEDFIEQMLKAKEAVDKNDKEKLKEILETLLKRTYNQ